MSNIIINLSSCQIHRRRKILNIGYFNVYLSLRRDLHIKNYSATKFELVLKYTLKELLKNQVHPRKSMLNTSTMYFGSQVKLISCHHRTIAVLKIIFQPRGRNRKYLVKFSDKYYVPEVSIKLNIF